MLRHEGQQRSTVEKITRNMAAGIGILALAGAALISGKGALAEHQSASEQFNKAATMSLDPTGAQLGNAANMGSIFESEAVEAQSNTTHDAPRELHEEPQSTDDPFEAYVAAMNAANTTEITAFGLDVTSAWMGFGALSGAIVLGGTYLDRRRC